MAERWTITQVGSEPRIERDPDGRWHIFMPGWVMQAKDGSWTEFQDGAAASFETDSEVSADQMENGWMTFGGYSIAELRRLALNQPAPSADPGASAPLSKEQDRGC